MKPLFALVVIVLLAAGCDYGVRLSGTPPTQPVASAGPKPAGTGTAAAGADPLGPKPSLAAPKPFAPAAPQVFQGPNGITVWLVERPDLPLVTATFIVPYGSASDPPYRPGTMYLLADMLDEGAGQRGALELSDAVSALGASLSVYASADGSFAQVSSLKGKFDDAFAILADVVARPKLDTNEFGRVKKLWKNALKKRADEPNAVASVVTAAVLYDQRTPYGHPTSGLLSKADLIDLGALKGAYEKTWRPDRATLVVVGQITRAEI
jgi:zinc protease